MKNLPVHAALVTLFVVVTALTKAPPDAETKPVQTSGPTVGVTSTNQLGKNASYNQSRILGTEQNRKTEPVAVDGLAEVRLDVSLGAIETPTNSSRSDLIEVGEPMKADDQNVQDYLEDLEPISIGQEMDAGQRPIWVADEVTEAIDVGEWRDAGESFPFEEPEDLRTISIGKEMDPERSY